MTTDAKTISVATAEEFEQLILIHLQPLLSELVTEESKSQTEDDESTIEALLDLGGIIDFSREDICSSPDLQRQLVDSASPELAGHIMSVWLTLFEEKAAQEKDETRYPNGCLHLSTFDDRMLMPGVDEQLWNEYVNQVTLVDENEAAPKKKDLIELFRRIKQSLSPNETIPACARTHLEAQGIIFLP